VLWLAQAKRERIVSSLTHQGLLRFRGRAHLKRKGLSHLRSLQQQPARLRSYFRAPAIRYAA
jgi:hypothetical protein